MERGLVDVDELARLFERVAPELVRYPAIDEPALRHKLTATLEELRGDVDAK